ncbi:chalcone isomerase family protein [Chondromyces apiculatus]|uniref:Chalcone isomerase domain-containing protein n=1 Tax=Chondromyces apiculatus DSM 436 TaxID=1192034 RepID=A0A017SWI8_9BACT|nr:chalcone isomerase family protein [Chondromyces apiculatus]EYF01107.1 Hypothetical protein CAP_8612 [Chondromyces apiculatus DSM 436]
MKTARSKIALLVPALMALMLAVTNLWALEPGPDGYYQTGEGIRVKTFAFIDVNVYRITHSIKQLPGTKSKQALIDADVDKKFVLTLMRDVDLEKMQNALKDSLALNGYKNKANVDKFLGAMTKELKENSRVTISYSAEKKATTIKLDGGTATVEGVDFMKGVWSIWFGKIDQPKLTEQLMSKLP